MSSQEQPRTGPLAGYRVLELCTTIAGPYCGRLFADFGAEVIKVEPPEGDPVRKMGYHDGDLSLYAAAILRNKQVVSIDLKTDRGRALVLELAARCDVVLENFRPGTLERMGLGFEALRERNPAVVLTRISGYGQSGPLRDKPGYGAVCEAFGGIRHLTGDPDRPPARVAVAATDYLTAVYAAFGTTMALLHREKTGEGQVVDAALYESAFSMMESIVPAYERLGIVPTRLGSRLQSMAPNNLYLAKDGAYVLIAANNDQIFRRLAAAMNRPELADHPDFSSIRARAANMDATDKLVGDWVATLTGSEAEERLERANVPVSRVYTIADIFDHPHYRARGMLIEKILPGSGTVTLPGIVPKLSVTPGEVREAGPEQGTHTRSALTRLLGLSGPELDDLEGKRIIQSDQRR